MGNLFMKSILRLFFQGLLILLPFVLTIYLVFLIFTVLNETLFSASGALLAHFFPSLEPGLETTLLGILFTLVVIILTGIAGSLYLTRYMMLAIDSLMERIPLVKMLYNTLKDLFNALLGEQKSFDKPVLVYLNSERTVKVMGFITSESMEAFNLTEQVAVYLPQSYNFAGNLIVVAKDQVEALDIPASQVMTFIVSGGVTTQQSRPED